MDIEVKGRPTGEQHGKLLTRLSSTIRKMDGPAMVKAVHPAALYLELSIV